MLIQGHETLEFKSDLCTTQACTSQIKWKSLGWRSISESSSPFPCIVTGLTSLPALMDECQV